ncbi:peptidoglycan recognition protein family protein [Streptomyces sp. HNM1019]|uniref:peptidoglycan recognition protein family protein n=1 Tax=Streptomyces sp. HNM1019 TaxID=3424717 RepID=UPI003D77ECD6
MRAYMASSIGVACTAALALPLALYPDPAHARAWGHAQAQGGAQVQVQGQAHARVERTVAVGSTRSLPLRPSHPSVGGGLGRGVAAGRGEAAFERGVTASGVRPFSLVGVVWDRPSAELRGRVQVRTRAVGGAWSPWRELLPYGDEAPDPDSPELRGARAHGGTAPLWVGASDAVQARARPERAGTGADAEAGAEGVGTGDARAGDAGAHAAALPSGLRLELIEPGEPPVPPGPDRAALRALPGQPVPTGAGSPGKPAKPGKPGKSGKPAKSTPRPPVSVTTTPQPSAPGTDTGTDTGTGTDAGKVGAAARDSAPRPSIVTRAGWGADEKIRETGHAYSKTVKVAFIHHTVTGNNYSCAQVPSVLRSIYRYHVKSLGWRDYGYNFTIDKCGKIYEGRSGGVTKAVRGAHTLGFNADSMGIAVLGTFTSKKPPAKAVRAIAELTAWKLGLFKRNPRGTTQLASGGGNKYKKGASVKLHVIAGHSDGFATECPGKLLYGKLGSVRKTAARLQGR